MPMQPLSDAEIDAAVATLAPSWRREGDSIVAELECRDFASAIELVNAIAAQAERADHHPDILIHGYRRLTITLSTHAAGGVTQRDIALAAAIDALAAA
jgi:4a-hydroxytetrahydrobiopterin dehydratase